MRAGLAHLGWSGLCVTVDGVTLRVDAPASAPGPSVVTWTEQERVRGVGGGVVAARPEVLAWLGRDGVALVEGAAVDVDGWSIAARAYRPIPYATPAEALRKTRSALFAPAVCVGRVRFTLGRPASPPVALRIERAGARVVLLGQALHRFLSVDEVRALATWAGPADLVVAGTDWDDEGATGAWIGMFDARMRVIADLTGEIRRALRLPTRPLGVALAAAPRGTRRLGPGERLRLG